MLRDSIARWPIVVASTVLLVTGKKAEGSAILVFTDRPTFDVAVGPTTTDDFGTTPAYPIPSGVLDATTSLVAGNGTILPGRVQPGVTYSTPIGSGNFFNLDGGGVFPGATLDRFGNSGTSATALTVTFANPITAFGFDTNATMGSQLFVTINFTSGTPFSTSMILPPDFFHLYFFGFQSVAADIISTSIYGTGAPFAFAVDNFSVASAEQAAVPEPATLLLVAMGLMAARAGRQFAKPRL